MERPTCRWMILEEEGEEVKGKRLEVECWEWESSRETIFFLEKKCFFRVFN